MDDQLEQWVEGLARETLGKIVGYANCRCNICGAEDFSASYSIEPIRAALRTVAREYWDKAYKAHALDVLAGDQVTPNPMEEN